MIVLLAVGYACAGYRRGLVVAAFSFAGFLTGVLIGSALAPAVARTVIGRQGGPDAVGQRLVAVLTVVVAAVSMEGLAGLLGRRARSVVRSTPLGVVDGAGGAAFAVVGLLFVTWLLGSFLVVTPFPTVVKQIRHSAILDAVDGVLPSRASQLFADVDRLLQRHDLPALENPFDGLPVPPVAVAPPDAGVVPPALKAAGPEVLKITGIAPSCGREQEGSGFVFAAEHVMTNAHVVAGVHDPQVALPGPGAQLLPARVVLYDPNRDVAVLDVPGLTRPALPFDGPQPTGTSAVVAGYPEDGPLTAVPARIAGDQDVTGPNIYADRQVTRDVYTLRARVRPGNSGGPLLGKDGAVYGVVFAASTDQSDVGYALTSSEVSGDANAGANATSQVSTQGCD
ncbi:MAG TPA: MarP family serine protease [Mycobacteriales bacterium]|nr:MarP family serine protease [Mycobacteriales bacterium]